MQSKVYTYDPALKGTFRRRLFLYYGLCFLLMAGIILGIPLASFAMTGSSAPPLLWAGLLPAALLGLLLALAYRKSLRRYDTAEVELTDGQIEFRLPNSKASTKIALGDITSIMRTPNMLDRKQLLLGGKGLRFLRISSYLRDFDELEERLKQAKPGVKLASGQPYRIFWQLLSAAATLLIFAGIFFCKPLMAAGLALLTLRLAIRGVVAYRNAGTKKMRIVCAVYFSFLLLVYAALAVTFLADKTLGRFSLRTLPGEFRLRPWILMEQNTYDKSGNLIYHKNFDEDDPEEYKSRYDAENRETYYKDLLGGYEEWYEYDSDSDRIAHSRDSDGYESWYEYDSGSGLLVHQRDSEGWESWTEYDDDGNETHYRTSEGFERWTSYDGSAKLSTDTEQRTTLTEYDSMKNIVHFRRTQGDSTAYEYWSDFEGDKATHTRYADGREVWKRYDAAGRLLNERWQSGEEHSYEYDDQGNLVHYTAREASPGGDAPAATEDIRYEYNGHGDMTRFDREGAEAIVLYDYTYDRKGRMLKAFASATRRAAAEGRAAAPE